MSDDIHEWVLNLRLAAEQARAAGKPQITITASLAACESIAMCVDAYFHTDNEPPCFLCAYRRERGRDMGEFKKLTQSLGANVNWRRNANPKRR